MGTTSAEAKVTESTETNVLLLHINKVADKTGLTPYKVRQLIEAGRLPSEQIGARTYVPVAAVARFIEELS